jgi:CRP/FNR family nitrogen fixation transcriptional regulator
MSITETAELGAHSTMQPVAWSRTVEQRKAIRPSTDVDDSLSALQTIGTQLRFSRNQTIFNEGDAAEYAYKLKSGTVRLCKYLADGRRQIMQFLFPGDLFSFMELDGHHLTAEAVNDVVLKCYPHRQIVQLGSQDPQLGMRMATLMSQRLHSMHVQLLLLGRQTATERIASFLLSLKERMGADEDELFEIAMSRQDVADYLGLTIETVCRVLSKMRRSRVIGIPNLHQLRICDTDALYDLAESGD